MTPHRFWTAICFLLLSLSLLTWYLTGRNFAPSLDEGIYLQGGRRILDGQIPYRDFFAFTGPLIYLLQAGMQQFFGADVAALRSMVAISIASIAAGGFALGTRIGGWRSGLTGALLWWGFAFSIQHRFVVNHRWLSSAAFGLAGVLLFQSQPGFPFVVGVLLGLSYWTTPSFVVPAGLLTIYLLATNRRGGLMQLAGQALVSIPMLFWLNSQQALSPLFKSLLWIQRNYASANAISYAYSAGYASWVQRIAALSGPIMLPLVILACAYLVLSGRRKELALPFLYTLGLFATAYPRWDALQLFFVTAPAFAIAVALVLPSVSLRLEPLVMGGLLLAAAYLPLSAFAALDHYSVFPSRVGTLLAREDSMEGMDRLASLVPAQSTCFVYPYLSFLYFHLQVKNPARFEYLQPGMMTAEDEAVVLSDLMAAPPAHVLWQYMPPEAVLESWPNANRDKLRFDRIERFIREGYETVEEVGSSQFRVQVWRRKP